MAHEVAARDHDQGGNEHVVLKAHGQAAALLDAVEERRAAQVAVRPRAWHDVFAALPRVIVTDSAAAPAAARRQLQRREPRARRLDVVVRRGRDGVPEHGTATRASRRAPSARRAPRVARRPSRRVHARVERRDVAAEPAAAA